MTSNRLKNLARLRLILSVLAVLLAGVMVFSGFMYYQNSIPALPEEEPAESVVESPETQPSEPPATTEATETTEASEEVTEPEITEGSETEATLKPEPESSHGIWPFGTIGSTGSDVESDATEPSATEPAPETISPAPSGGDHNYVRDHDTPSNPSANTPSHEEHHENTGNEGQNAPGNEISDPSPVTESDGNTDSAEQIPPDSASAADPSADAPSQEAPQEEAAQPDLTPSESETDNTETQKLNIKTNISTKPEENLQSLWFLLCLASGGLLILDLVAIIIVSSQIKKERQRLQRVRKSLSQTDEHARRAGVMPVQATESIQPLEQGIQIGTLHQVGRRDYQQDSLGHASVLNSKGILAVLADGMGGLSGGEKVSQKIVMDALEMGRQLKPEQTNGVLWKMVDVINNNVNQMLGPDGLYKSGSTLLAVLAYNGKFQWIAVGDSRIYLYRQGYANQLNHDHDQLQVWMADVLSGRRSMEEVLRNPEGKKLTSFIGMGQLKYIDGSRGAIALEPGDRLVLMSDGVYNVVGETALAGILKRYPDVDQAASVIDRMIREHNHPHQDNYTAIVLGF